MLRVRQDVKDAIQKMKEESNNSAPLSYIQLVMGLLPYMSVVDTDEINTAMVYRNPNSLTWEIGIGSLAKSYDEIRFIIMHEVSHVLFHHMDISDEDKKNFPDMDVQNIAMDAQLNSYIINKATEKLVAPVNAPQNGKGYSGLDSIYDHLSWQEIYPYAAKHKASISKKIAQLGISGNGNTQGNGLADGSGKQKGQEGDAITTLLTGERDSSGINKDSSTGSIEIDKLIDEKLKKDIGDLINKVVKKAGHNRGDASVIIDELAEYTKVNERLWEKTIKRYLNGFQKNNSEFYSSYARPSRRFGEGVRGKVRAYNKGKLAVLVDCSGSMRSVAMRAVKNLAVISNFCGGIDRVVFWNTELVRDFKNIKKTTASKVVCEASGGTELTEGIRMLASQNYNLLIIITDLELSDYGPVNDFETIERVSSHTPIVIGKYGESDHQFKNRNVHVIDLEEEGI